MVGYVYITKNTINNRIYIGKHESDKYDSSYLGSGKILKQAIDKYGKDNFTNSILYTAETIDELNSAEQAFIKEYRDLYGDAMYNIASGGDGGNVFKYATEDERSKFISKMTEINRKRCSSDEFKRKISKATSERYKSKEERDKQSETSRRAWSSQALRDRQSEKLLSYYKTHNKDNSYRCRRCRLEMFGKCYIFNSRKELEQYLKDEHNLTINRKLMTYLLETHEPYEPFHKNKLGRFRGMRMEYIQQNENVETIGDECSRVGREIGTRSKRKTEKEDIVHAV